MKELKCPKCKNQELTSKDVSGTPIDQCEKCGGLWLDKGELNKIAHPIQGDVEFCTHTETGDKKLSGIKCPRCDGLELHQVKFIEFTDIILDHCPQCDGIWLDKKELDAINAEIDSLVKIPESWDHRIMAFLAKLPF